MVPWRRSKRESYAIKSFNGYWHARALLLLTGGLWVVSDTLRLKHFVCTLEITCVEASLACLITHKLKSTENCLCRTCIYAKCIVDELARVIAAGANTTLGLIVDPRVSCTEASAQHHKLDSSRLAMPVVSHLVIGRLPAPVLAPVLDVMPRNPKVAI